MICIAVKFPIRPDKADSFMDEAAGYTAATRAEEGNVFFEWSRSLDEPNTFVLLEAFRDADAGAAHVATDHFKEGVATLQRLVAKTPDIINVEVPGDSWSKMGEVTVD